MKKLKNMYSSVPEAGIITALLVLMVITQIYNEKFLTFANMTTLLKSIPFIGLVALGSSICLLTGGLDLACGRIAGLCGMVFGFTHTVMGLSLPVSIILGVFTGVAFGIVHGLGTVKLGINAFIVTMGTLYVSGGLRYIINHGDPMNLPPSYRDFSQATPLGISWMFWIVVAIFIIIGFIQAKTKFGRSMYAVGNNAKVAELQAINVGRVKFIAYVICGLFSGMAGVMATFDINSSQAATGTGWEFQAIAACFVGGTSLSGGKGRAFGVAIGVFFIFVMDNIINMIGVSYYWAECFTGLVLLGSVLFDAYRKNKKIRA